MLVSPQFTTEEKLSLVKTYITRLAEDYPLKAFKIVDNLDH